jgi:acyl carrier protein
MSDTPSEHANRLLDILRPRLRFLKDGEDLTLDSDLGKLGLDSMGSIDLLMDLEAEMGVEIPEDSMDVNTFSTPGHLLAAIESQLTV